MSPAKNSDRLAPIKSTAFIALSCALFAAQASLAEPSKLLITNDLTERYNAFVNNRNILSIEHYYSPERGRQLTEAILFQQAIALGGYDNPLQLWESPKDNYIAEIEQITSGKVAAMAVTGWREDAQKHTDKLYISSPIIRQGEYQVGLYTHSDNKPLLAIKSAQELEHFSAVTNHNWSADWRTLNSLSLRKIYDNPSWMAHLKMLATKRVDFMLLPFQNNPDLSLYYNPNTRTHLTPVKESTHPKNSGIRLIPIPGIKLRINGERCFYVSKKHPEGAAIFTALESGIKQLRARGTIVKAMKEAKFFHPATRLSLIHI